MRRWTRRCGPRAVARACSSVGARAPNAASASGVPLLRWSRGLAAACAQRTASDLRYPALFPCLEGCRSAFNATGSIRTCLFFGSQPPTFLGASSFADIRYLAPNDDDDAVGSPGAADTGGTDGLPVAFFRGDARGGACLSADTRTDPVVTVALENFVAAARSVHDAALPDVTAAPRRVRLVAGHENDGVSASELDRARASHGIVFIPLGGTISSLNVVASLGVAMYQFHLDALDALAARQGREPVAAAGPRRRRATEGAFAVDCAANDWRAARLAACGAALPRRADSSREDPRPIHPSFYQLPPAEIQQRHSRELAAWRGVGGNGGSGGRAVPRFSVAVFIENDYDQRSIGGVVRSANAFLADVFYTGRRRLSAQGAVGTNHYTRVRHVASVAEAVTAMRHDAEGGSDVAVVGGDDRATAVWLLSCEHDALFEGPLADTGDANITNADSDADGDTDGHWARRRLAFRCDGDALAAYQKSFGDGEADVFFDDPAATVAAAATAGGVCTRLLLVVPPEGRLPSAAVVAACSRRVRLVRGVSGGVAAGANAAAPPPLLAADRRGLPVSVAASIALQRVCHAVYGL